MGKPEGPKRPDYSFWFADLAATPGLSEQAMRVAMRVGAIGMTPNAKGHRLYFESLATITRATGVPRRTAQRALARLVEVGLLVVAREARGRGNPTQYALQTNGAEARSLAAAAVEKGATNVAPIRPKGCHSRDAHSEQKGRHKPDALSSERVPSNAERVPPSCPERVPPGWRGNLQESSESPGPRPPLEAAGRDPNPMAGERLAERKRVIKAQRRKLLEEAGDTS